MSTNSLLRRLMIRSFRSQITLPIRKPRDVGRRIEELEDRITPTTGLTPADQELVAAYGQLPLSFEPNEGQTASQVQYLSQGSGYTLFLTSTSSVLSLVQPSNSSESTTPTASPAATTSTGVALAMNLVGSNPSASVVGQGPLPGTSNDFIGNNPSQWHTNIANYSKVAYQDVYPGINLVYYGNQQQLEYDFDVAPGANPGAIRFDVQGASSVSLDSQGNLVLCTASGNVVEHAPVIYQTVGGAQQSIAGQFVLLGQNQVSFQVGAYNTALPLVIDPVLIYSTYLGGSSGDFGEGIEVDSSGDAYITGYTTSTNYPTTTGAFQTTLGGSDAQNAFVTKLNTTGTALVYSTYLGGSNSDEGQSIAVDSSGDAYITGTTNSTNFPTTSSAFQTTLLGYDSAFVTKLNSTGTALVYSTYLGGSIGDHGTGIAVDSSGDAYITGFASSGDFPTTTSAFQTTIGGAFNAFVTKLNATGTALVYSTYLGGSNSLGGSDVDEGSGIAVDSSGDVYITGRTNSTNFPTTRGAYQTTIGGNYNAFVTKLNATGTALLYSTYLGGNDYDYGLGIVVDNSGDAYITGDTYSENFPTTSGAYQTNLYGDYTAFATKLNATGTALLNGTYLGGVSNYDSGSGIAVDSSGDAYITGLVGGVALPTTSGAFQTTFGGGTSNAYVTKLNATGTALLYSTYLGGSGQDGGDGIALDSLGNAYITGSASSTNFPTTSGADQTTNGGNSDVFVAKLTLGSLFPVGMNATLNRFGNLVITDTQGNADHVTVTVSGTNYVITDTLQAFTPGYIPAGTTLSNNNHTLTVPMSLVAGNLEFYLDGGNNTLVVNYSGGSFANPIIYDGGGEAGTTDGLVVQGSSTQNATYTPSGITDGSGTITGPAGEITFSDLTPVDITGLATVTMTFPNANDVVNLASGTDYLSGGTSPALDLTGTSGGVAFEQAAFWDVTSLVIDTTAVPGTDAVTIASANGDAAGITNLTVSEPTNQAGTIIVNGAMAFPGSISLTAGQSITVNANITGGTGGTTLLADGSAALDTVGVTVQNGAVVTATGSGPVSVTGTGGSGTSGYDDGVLLTGSGSSITSGGGAVAVTGTGGSDGVANSGVVLSGSVTTITSGMDGMVTVTGTGGSKGYSADGVELIGSDSMITSGVGGSVAVTGTGGTGGDGNIGVAVESIGSTITSGASGMVTVVGIGGSGSGGGNCGVADDGRILSAGSMTVTGIGGSGGSDDYGVWVFNNEGVFSDGSGPVSVTGTGGSGSDNDYGVYLSSGGVIQTETGESLSVTGNSGAGMSGGVYLNSGFIESVISGTISVTGTGNASSAAVSLDNNSNILTYDNFPITITADSTGNASSEAVSLDDHSNILTYDYFPITITADSLSIDSTSLINSGTGPTSIVPQTTGTQIALGGTDILSGSPLTLGLSAAEIAEIGAGTLNIGNTSSGEIDITAAIRFTSPIVNITTGTGNAIAFTGSGSLTSTGNNVTLTTSGTGAITSTTGATDITVGSGAISLNAGSGGIGASGSPIIVSGNDVDATTSGNGNEYLSSVGSITIDPTGVIVGSGTVELDSGIFALGNNNPIDANATLNVNGAMFAVGTFLNTVNTLQLTSGEIGGTTGVLTSTNTIQLQSGNVSAILTSTNGLTKTTNGTVTLSGANTYSGATTITDGTLANGANNALPSSTTLGIASPAIFDLAGFPQQVASITGTGTITDSGSDATLTIAGGGTFSGNITGTTGINETDGTLTLGGDDTYSSATTVTSGRLLITGSLTNSAVNVLAAGALGGTGSVQGVSISGDLAPGVDGVGTLTAEGNTTFTGANAALSVQLNGAGPGSSTQLAESGGTVALGTQTALVVTQTVPTAPGQTFTIISGAANITGTFAGLANNATFVSGGIQYRITYTTSAVTLTDITSTLTPATLPPGEVGLGYSQAITGVAGSPSATLAVSDVTNFTGLTISGSGTGTITVSGVPTATGTMSFTITPTYASETGDGISYSFIINSPVVLTPPTLPTGEVRLLYSQSITASGGSGAITLALSGVTNTTGLTISGNGTGTISLSGTPTSLGTVTFTVTPTDSIGTGAGNLYSFTVAPPVSLNPTTLPGGEVGVGYDQTITGSGGSGTITLAISAVTNTTGLTISGSGTGTISLSGTPDAAGTVTFTVTPTDSVGTGSGTLYSFIVSPSVVLNPSTLADGEVDIAYSQAITSTGGAAPVTLAVSGVTNSTGLTISGSATGTISVSGTPTSSGTVTFMVTPTDMVGTSNGTIYSFTVSPAVVLGPGTLPVGQVGVVYNQSITSFGGTGTITLALSNVSNPTGLTISGAGTDTITLSGTPTSSGTVSFTVTPTDSIGTSPAKTYSFTVASAVALAPTSLPDGEVGETYSQSITSTGGAAPVTLAVSGVTNTTGLTISGSGTGTISLTGTPTSSGTVSFTVIPTSASGTSPGASYTFTVAPTIVLDPTTLPTGEVGMAYSQAITGSGGSGAITLALSGVTNTTGLTISGNGTGTISLSGTPTSSGTVSFTVTPIDSIGTGKAQTYSFTIAPPVALNPTTLPGGEEGLVYNRTITASGGPGTISLALSGLTNTTGLTISGGGTGTISLSGTPTSAGTVTFTVTPRDSIGTSSGTTYSFRVSPPVVFTPSTLPGGEVGIAYSQSIAANGGAAPVSLAVSGVINTTGLIISGNGTGAITLSGTPASSGTVTFTVTPTDEVGTSAARTYSFTVASAVIILPRALPAGEVGTNYSQTITSTGGVAPVTLAVSNMTNATGLSISGTGTGTITISGPPTSAGIVTFIVTPTDGIGTGAGTEYSLDVKGGTSSPPPPPPPVTGTPQPILVGGNSNGTVEVDTESNGTYTLQETLTPFGNIPADVRTAVGDINGDGIPDYIFATGPGTPFEVTVLSGAPGNAVLVAPFDPFLPAPPEAQTDLFTAGGFVTAGDFLGNGRDQIVVSPDQAGGPRISIYDMDGAATAAAQPYTPVGVNTAEINPGSGLTRINNFLSVNANFRGGARTAVGDLNGDGVPDLAIAAGFGGGPAVLVINGTKVPTTDGFTPSDDLIGDFFAFNSTLRDGAYLAIGDVLGNGQQDLILTPGAGGPAEVEVLSGEQLVAVGAVASIASPVANFAPTDLGPDGAGLRVAVASSGVGDQVNVVVGAGRNMPGVAKVYPGTSFTSGNTNEPTGGQLLDPFGGGSLADGIFVG